MTDEPVAAKIELIPGINPILLIAPHGVMGDDDYTGTLTKAIANKLKCYAIINEAYRRPKEENNEIPDKAKYILDLNSIAQAKTFVKKEFFQPIIDYKNIINKIARAVELKPLVVMIHGIDDSNIKTYYGDDTAIVIGIGLGKPDHPSCDRKHAESLTDSLNRLLQPQKAVFSSERIKEDPLNKYAGWNPDNLNQLFTHKASKYIDKSVQSVQVEIKYTGFRDEKNIVATADRLSDALGKLGGIYLAVPAKKEAQDKVVELRQKEEAPDETLVEDAYLDLKSIFAKNYARALLEAGQYIIDNFYDGNIELARNHKPARGKSLNLLYNTLHPRVDACPSRSWIFNAVKIAVDEADYGSFQTYGKLSPSKKVLLLPVKDRKTKELLIKESVESGYGARKLKERIKEVIQPKTKEITISHAIEKPDLLFSDKCSAMFTKNYLAKLPSEEAATIREKAQAKIEALQAELAKTGDYIKRYKELVAVLEKGGEVDKAE